MKLTPRQGLVMLTAFGKEKRAMFTALGAMFGAKPAEKSEIIDDSKDDDLSEYDQKGVDSLTNKHALSLKTRAK